MWSDLKFKAHILKAVSKSMKTLWEGKPRFYDKVIINNLKGLKIIYCLDLDLWWKDLHNSLNRYKLRKISEYLK